MYVLTLSGEDLYRHIACCLILFIMNKICIKSSTSVTATNVTMDTNVTIGNKCYKSATNVTKHEKFRNA